MMRADTTTVTTELFEGPRSPLLPLFRQADDSLAEIESYIDRGDVLVARLAGEIAGHVQLVESPGAWEIVSVAVLDAHQRRGVGTMLVRAAVAHTFAAGGGRVAVATATADIANLRFYQRLGFRMDRIERDAFSADRGYNDLVTDGIPVRDRVWFSMERSADR